MGRISLSAWWAEVARAVPCSGWLATRPNQSDSPVSALKARATTETVPPANRLRTFLWRLYSTLAIHSMSARKCLRNDMRLSVFQTPLTSRGHNWFMLGTRRDGRTS
ncbi:hypothetical protein AMJ85_10200 [candidate division BRC1 bacterium SM23_51]|nr:MAG: hypothetical protein AMJ85_10200 [candidate division BRC1 bacterium SM23_51]